MSKIESELKTLVKLPESADNRRLYGRLMGLGHSQVCGRCGGSGQYSYCQMYGTTCFGCGGSGQKAPKIDSRLLAAVREQAASGAVDTYLADLARRGQLKRAGKTISDRYFAAWEALPQIAADKAGKVHFSVQSELSTAINHVCAGLYDQFVKQQSIDLGMGKQWQPDAPGSSKGHYVAISDADLETMVTTAERAIVLAGKVQSMVEASMASGNGHREAGREVLAAAIAEMEAAAVAS